MPPRLCVCLSLGDEMREPPPAEPPHATPPLPSRLGCCLAVASRCSVDQRMRLPFAVAQCFRMCAGALSVAPDEIDILQARARLSVACGAADWDGSSAGGLTLSSIELSNKQPTAGRTDDAYRTPARHINHRPSPLQRAASSSPTPPPTAMSSEQQAPQDDVRECANGCGFYGCVRLIEGGRDRSPTWDRHNTARVLVYVCLQPSSSSHHGTTARRRPTTCAPNASRTPRAPPSPASRPRPRPRRPRRPPTRPP